MNELDVAQTVKRAAYGIYLDPFHLVRPDHAWYADIEAKLPRRHYSVAQRVKSPFQTRSDFVHLGVVGHQGTGKTTLVRQAMSELRDIGILSVYVDALEVLDPLDFSFSDVVLVITEAVVSKVVQQDPNLHLDPTLLKSVHGWFAEEIVSEEHREELVGEIESEAGAGLDVPFIAKLLTRIKGTLRSSNDYRVEIRRRAGRDPAELLRRVNQLLDGIHAALADRKQKLCVVFDNLEKVRPRETVERAVLQRTNDLRQLRCHAVYFLAPADQYAPGAVQADQALLIVQIPVLPVRFFGDPWTIVRSEAVDAVQLLLSKRIDLNALFETPRECVEAMVRWSGGRLRDVIDLARIACEFADIDQSKVTLIHVDEAAVKLAGSRLVAMRPESWARAVQIFNSKTVDNREADGHMLLHALVLAYDGRPWWDVHPLLKEDPRFSAAMKPATP
ncbi:MAG: AAA family ATPase [Nannocystaceae bacterium]